MIAKGEFAIYVTTDETGHFSYQISFVENVTNGRYLIRLQDETMAVVREDQLMMQG